MAFYTGIVLAFLQFYGTSFTFPKRSLLKLTQTEEQALGRYKIRMIAVNEIVFKSNTISSYRQMHFEFQVILLMEKFTTIQMASLALQILLSLLSNQLFFKGTVRQRAIVFSCSCILTRMKQGVYVYYSRTKLSGINISCVSVDRRIKLQ